MKKILLIIVVSATALTFTSCYSTRILVGNVKPTEPLVEVNKEWNHGMIAGIVPMNLGIQINIFIS